jgi:nitroreductase
MKDFMELARARFSLKKYSDRKVRDEDIQKMLEAAQAAPTAKNMQPEHIYVMKSADALAKMDQVTPCRYGATVMFAFTYDKNNIYRYEGHPELNSGVEDCSIPATFMMLEAKDLGIDTCWINRFSIDKLKELFDLPENEQPVLLMDAGYPAEGAGPLPNHSKTKPLDEIVTYL